MNQTQKHTALAVPQPSDTVGHNRKDSKGKTVKIQKAKYPRL